MPDEKEEQFERLAQKAMGALLSFLSEQPKDSKQIMKARVAVTALTAWTRYVQTKGARDAMNLMMARELATNKEELKKYLAVSTPDSPLVKRLALKSG